MQLYGLLFNLFFLVVNLGHGFYRGSCSFLYHITILQHTSKTLSTIFRQLKINSFKGTKIKDVNKLSHLVTNAPRTLEKRLKTPICTCVCSYQKRAQEILIKFSIDECVRICYYKINKNKGDEIHEKKNSKVVIKGGVKPLALAMGI